MIDTEALRKKVLDLAIRGKLTQQLPEDGTAEELALNIREQKKKIEKSGVLKGRKSKSLEPINEIPELSDIPSTWKWIRLGEVAEIFGRIGFRGYKKSDIVAPGQGAITISPSNITNMGKTVFDKCTFISWDKYEESPEIMVEEKDLLIVKTGSTYGKCGIVNRLPEKATINPQLAILKYILCDRYFLNYVLNSSFARNQYEIFVVGAAVPTFSQEKLANFIMPLPPLAEQKRIVEKVEAIFSVLDKIDLLQSEYRNNLSVLKTKIIEAGIQGKLTEQLPEDGTAEELYEQIQKEKQDLIKEGKIKKEKPLPPITEDEVPFAVPDNWKWVRLADITTKIASGNTPAGGKKSSVYKENGYCFFREQNVHNDGIHYEGMVYISEELLNTRPNSTVLPKDILLNITGGSIGRASLIPETFYKGSINQHILIIRMVNYDVRYYIHHLLRSAYGQKYIKQKAVGDKEGFSGGRCKNMPIPLPPLAEQKRIVAKLDEVLAILDGKQAE